MATRRKSQPKRRPLGKAKDRLAYVESALLIMLGRTALRLHSEEEP